MFRRCLVWMLLLQLLLRLENMMTALLMMPGLQKLIQGNHMKVRMRTLILLKMVIVVVSEEKLNNEVDKLHVFGKQFHVLESFI